MRHNSQINQNSFFRYIMHDISLIIKKLILKQWMCETDFNFILVFASATENTNEVFITMYEALGVGDTPLRKKFESRWSWRRKRWKFAERKTHAWTFLTLKFILNNFFRLWNINKLQNIVDITSKPSDHVEQNRRTEWTNESPCFIMCNKLSDYIGVVTEVARSLSKRSIKPVYRWGP